ncbi:MAG: thiamine-phosphate kinase [Succinivibrio sp.]
MAIGEFDLIKKYFTAHDSGEGILLGVGDDCAIIDVPPCKQLALTTDTQIEKVHFFTQTDPYLIGYKSLLVNVSDLAAMGAEPYCFTLSLTLPTSDELFLERFSDGLFSLSSKLKMPLIGGNTTKGELSVTVSAYGLLPRGKSLRRDAARIDDDIYVTGSLGLSGLAVELGYHHIELEAGAFDDCYKKSMLIKDRCAFAQELLEYAHAALDISDGLVGDLNHILESSGVGALIQIERIPYANEFELYGVDENIRDHLCLYGGGDYELLFTAPVCNREKIAELSERHSVPVSRIGKIKNGILHITKHGNMYNQNEKPFEHF